MAKYTATFSGKGFLNMDEMTITEVKKDEENVFDLLSQLQSFDGKEISITIKEDIEVIPVEEN